MGFYNFVAQVTQDILWEWTDGMDYGRMGGGGNLEPYFIKAFLFVSVNGAKECKEVS